MNDACYLVTGASGFVGRHLCRRLRDAGQRVRGLVRRDDPSLAALGVEMVHGDLNAPGAWQERLDGVDFVIHCAANADFRSTASQAAVNVDGTRHLIDAARQRGKSLRRFVLVSTIGAIDRAPADRCTEPLDVSSPFEPQSDYGRSKAKAEELTREAGLPFTIVRPAMVVGSDMRVGSHFAAFARMACDGSPVARFAWPGAFSVVHVDDLAAALQMCATHPGAEGCTFFCAGTAMTIRDCFGRARPESLRLPLGWTIPIARRAAGILPFRIKAMVLPALVASDASLRELGWQPRHSAPAVLDEVISRERARCDPGIDPGGQAIITGAASGLGRSFVDRLAPHRRHLLLVDRDREGLEQAKAQHPHCRTAVADLADEHALAQLVESETWRAHPVSEIFACAGFGIRGPVLNSSADQQAGVFKVNVLSRLFLAHAALPGMIRAQFGRIVLVSSSSAFQPLPYMSTYAASNAALLSLGEAWAAELAGTGVHVLVACPGGMQTNFQRSAGVKTLASERLMPPGEVADRIMRALAKRKTTVIISGRALAMSLLARLLPRATSVALWGKLMTRLR